jgi:DNA polymerase III subunit epsilon
MREQPFYYIVDTETTGLFDFNRPADAEGQPRLASIALLCCDHELRLIAATSVVIRPDGWEMPAEAERINGLSTEFLTKHGAPVQEVLWRYSEEINWGSIVVAHNAQYDTKVMRAELRRAGMDDLYARTQTLCTMNALTDVCAIPKANGRGNKWPKLSEAIWHCLGREHANAHGALPDALGCLDLLRWMRTGGFPLIGEFPRTVANA